MYSGISATVREELCTKQRKTALWSRQRDDDFLCVWLRLGSWIKTQLLTATSTYVGGFCYLNKSGTLAQYAIICWNRRSPKCRQVDAF